MRTCWTMHVSYSMLSIGNTPTSRTQFLHFSERSWQSSPIIYRKPLRNIAHRVLHISGLHSSSFPNADPGFETHSSAMRADWVDSTKYIRQQVVRVFPLSVRMSWRVVHLIKITLSRANIIAWLLLHYIILYMHITNNAEQCNRKSTPCNQILWFNASLN